MRTTVATPEVRVESYLTLRVSKSDKRVLRKAARAAKMTLSDWVRGVMMSASRRALGVVADPVPALGSMSEAEVQEITTAAMG